MKIKKDGWLVFFVKILLAAAIFYIALVLVANQNRENIVLENLDYLSMTGDKIDLLTGAETDVLLQEAMQEILGTGHSSSILDAEEQYKAKFQRLCVENILVCVKVRFDGNLSYKDKFLYMASVVKVFGFLDEHSQTRADASKQINEILIRQNGGSKRGYATKNYIEINLDLVQSYTEFFDLLTHEAGHVWDLGVVNGNSSQKDKNYTEFGKTIFSVDDPSIEFYEISWDAESIMNADSDRESFVSRYAASDPFEDLAEAFVLYVNHNAVFRYLAQYDSDLKQKYNYLANLFDGNYLFKGTTEISLFTKDHDYRVWDVTRITSF